MAKPGRIERRADALSRERIVAAAIEILDSAGEGALTFRALAAHLATGSGAIYYRVADKQELLAVATDQIIATVIENGMADRTPREAVRTLASDVFDAIDAHPWLGAQLSGDPWQSAVLRILEGIGAPLEALGVPQNAQFNAATALLSLILGLASQYALGARHYSADMDRKKLLEKTAARWARLDPAHYPFVRQVATHLADHDDRQQFMAAIDLVLVGIESIRA